MFTILIDDYSYVRNREKMLPNELLRESQTRRVTFFLTDFETNYFTIINIYIYISYDN